MRLDDRFSVAAPIDEVYATILDVERVTGCVPGAELLGKQGDDAYAVGIRVKVGPITMQYRGDVEIVERDAAAHRAVMKVTAREVRGQGTANATAELRLSEQDGMTQGDVHVDVALSGRAASMGQGAIQDVTSKLVGRFARNLTRMLEQGGVEAGEAASAVGATLPREGDAAAAGAAGPRPTGPAPADEDDDAISAGEIVGAVVAGRLRSPYVTVGLALVTGLVAFLLGRRSAG